MKPSSRDTTDFRRNALSRDVRGVCVVRVVKLGKRNLEERCEVVLIARLVVDFCNLRSFPDLPFSTETVTTLLSTAEGGEESE